MRYYERRGLLGPAPRSIGGHRLYPSETVTRVRMIKAAQRLRFILEEIAAVDGFRPDRWDVIGASICPLRARLAA